MKISIKQILFIQSLLNREVLNNISSSDINIALIKANKVINEILYDTAIKVKELSKEEFDVYVDEQNVELKIDKIKLNDLPKTVLDSLTREQFVCLNPILDTSEI